MWWYYPDGNSCCPMGHGYPTTSFISNLSITSFSLIFYLIPSSLPSLFDTGQDVVVADVEGGGGGCGGCGGDWGNLECGGGGDGGGEGGGIAVSFSSLAFLSFFVPLSPLLSMTKPIHLR